MRRWLYRLECYLPAAKRQYGYFALPVLYGREFIARVDCKAQRREQRLHILQLHWEKGAPNRETIAAPLWQALNAFARFNRCTRVELPRDNEWLQHSDCSSWFTRGP